ncbi:MAG: SbcC/MukB-like Walker B domain-containing protein, partial [Alphaproteobacteria bacterium]
LEQKAAEVLGAYLAGAASALAGDLVPNEPCPVCGSREHPSPATAEAGAPGIDRETVERHRKAADDARASIEAAAAEIGRLEAELGSDVGISLADAAARLEQARIAATESERASSRLREIEDSQRSLQAEIDQAADAFTAAAAEEANAKARHAAALEELAKAREQAGDDDAARLDAVKSSLGLALGAVATWQGTETTLASAAAVLAERRATLEHVVRAGGWADAAAALAREMAPERLAAEKAEVEKFGRDMTHASAQLLTIEEQPPPPDRPDDEALQAEAERLQDESSKAIQRATRLELALERAREAVAKASDAGERGKDLREKHARADRVHRVCDGRGRERVALETWVLATELERVAAAASVHLQRMTSNRYRLERSDESGHRNKQAGLDLVVRDSHTGKTRSTATLSGGEQFQASLALALGLADVVSRGGRAGGHVYRSLFVDEGFGSLDERSLEQALSTLDQLRAGGRTVGVITHVELMKQSLPVGIEVEPCPDGGGSTLRVNPAPGRD